MVYGAVQNKSKHLASLNQDAFDRHQSARVRVLVAGNSALHANILRFLPERLYDVGCVDGRKELVNALEICRCDLLIIDISLKDLDGMTDIRSFCLNGKSHYVISYIENGEEVDKILSLELGADECLTSSCSVREIEARVRALLRRCASEKARLQAEHDNNNRLAADILYFSGWSINKDKFQVTSPAGIDIHLTRAEYLVLSGLVRWPILTKGQKNLLKCASDRGESCNDRSIDSIVSRIRKKMAKFGGEDLIETVRGQGYRLSAPVTRFR